MNKATEKITDSRVATVKARDAATVIVHRMVNSRTQVLLGRRHTKSSFMPDVYVFPGGVVEPADARIKPATDLDQRFASFMAVADKQARARTLANAAVRETYEECGLMIGRAGQTGKVIQDTWQEFHNLGLAPDLACLKYVGRAITPTFRKLRFHARFFSCDAQRIATDISNSALLNLDASDANNQGDGELQDIGWVDVDKIDSLPMRDVTRFMLEEQLSLSKKPDDQQIGNAVYLHREGKLQVLRQGE